MNRDALKYRAAMRQRSGRVGCNRLLDGTAPCRTPEQTSDESLADQDDRKNNEEDRKHRVTEGEHLERRRIRVCLR